MKWIKYIAFLILIFPLPFSCEDEVVVSEGPNICDQSIPLVLDEISVVNFYEVSENDSLLTGLDSILLDRLQMEVIFSLEDKLLSLNSGFLFPSARAHPCGDHYLEERPELTSLTVEPGFNEQLKAGKNLLEFFETANQFNSADIEKTSVVISPIGSVPVAKSNYVLTLRFETKSGQEFAVTTPHVVLY